MKPEKENENKHAKTGTICREKSISLLVGEKFTAAVAAVDVLSSHSNIEARLKGPQKNTHLQTNSHTYRSPSLSQ